MLIENDLLLTPRWGNYISKKIGDSITHDIERHINVVREQAALTNRLGLYHPIAVIGSYCQGGGLVTLLPAAELHTVCRLALKKGPLHHRGRHAKIFGWAKSAAHHRRSTSDIGYKPQHWDWGQTEIKRACWQRKYDAKYDAIDCVIFDTRQ